jgi:hypothetical protein
VYIKLPIERAEYDAPPFPFKSSDPALFNGLIWIRACLSPEDWSPDGNWIAVFSRRFQ